MSIGPISAKYDVYCAFLPVFSSMTKGVLTMANDSRTPESAEARIKKKALQAVEGQKAMVEYETGLRQMREKTERLRALRLARDEAEAKAAADAPPVVKKKAAKKKTAKASKAEEAAKAEEAEEAAEAEAAEAETEAVS
jgi:hypothetical protein